MQPLTLPQNQTKPAHHQTKTNQQKRTKTKPKQFWNSIKSNTPRAFSQVRVTKNTWIVLFVGIHFYQIIFPPEAKQKGTSPVQFVCGVTSDDVWTAVFKWHLSPSDPKVLLLPLMNSASQQLDSFILHGNWERDEVIHLCHAAAQNQLLPAQWFMH